MRYLIALLLLTGAAHADEKEEAVKTAAFRLTTAYQCAPIIGDDGPYEWAKANADEVLAAAAVASTTVNEIIAQVEAQGRNGAQGLTKELCSTLLAGFK